MSERLRVGYVLKKYPRLSETFVVDELRAVERAGADVSIFSLRPPDDGRFNGDLARVQGQVRYLPGFGSQAALGAFGALRGAGPGAPEALDRALSFLELIPPDRRAGLLVQSLHLAEWARGEGLDHLHAHFLTVAAHTAYLAHLFAGVPFSVTAHAKDVYRETVDRRVFRAVAEAATAVVTVCEANRRFIRDRLLAGRGRVVRVYNGVHVDELVPSTAPRDPGLVVAAGRLVEKKGFHVLLEALRRLDDDGVPARCVVLGEGEERDRLGALLVSLGLEGCVDLLGAASRDEVLRWMGRASVVVVPCLTGADGNRDALPTVLIEAMALGTPVVSTPVGGIPEIVRDGHDGLLVPQGDPVALADALRRVLVRPALAARLGAEGRRTVEARFDRAETVSDLVSLFGAGRRRPAMLTEGVR